MITNFDSLMPVFNPAEIMEETNTLIAGVTGSGKSNLLNLIIYQIMKQNPDECGLILMDASGQSSGLAKYAELPHAVINSVVYDKDDMIQVLETVQNIMQNRLDNMTAWDEYSDELPIYVIIDEFAAVRDTCGKEFDRILSDICRRCRKTRIHVIAATQDPSKKAIPANIVNNFTCRIALRCDDTTQSKQIIGISGAENLPKNGYAIVKKEGFSSEKISVPYLDMEHVRAAVEFWENSGFVSDWSYLLSDSDVSSVDEFVFTPPEMDSTAMHTACVACTHEEICTAHEPIVKETVLSVLDSIICLLMNFIGWIGKQFDTSIRYLDGFHVAKIAMTIAKIFTGVFFYVVIILMYLIKFFMPVILGFLKWAFGSVENSLMASILVLIPLCCIITP